MKVIIIPIVIGALGTVTKGLLKGLEDSEVGGRVKTIQTTALTLCPVVRDVGKYIDKNTNICYRYWLFDYIYIYIYIYESIYGSKSDSMKIAEKVIQIGELIWYPSPDDGYWNLRFNS